MVDADTKVSLTSNHTLYAHWLADGYMVSLNANEGMVSPNSITVKYGSAYGNLPTPVRTGYTFGGWFTKQTGGNAVDAKTEVSVTGNHTLYAGWSANEYTISFNGNGGTVSTNSIIVRYGSAYGSLPTPSRAGYAFEGWFTGQTGGTKVGADTKVSLTGNHTLYAHWSAGGYTISLNGSGGTISPDSITVKYGAAYGSLPTPSRTGYTFNEWFTEQTGGKQIKSSSSVESAANHTLYAQWTVNKYTIAFNANGGSVSQSSKSLDYGSSYGSLPNPTRDYYTFNGWYTDALDGTAVSSSTVVKGNQTLYAHWTENPLSGWSETVPDGAAIVETKTQYSYRDKKHKNRHIVHLVVGHDMVHIFHTVHGQMLVGYETILVNPIPFKSPVLVQLLTKRHIQCINIIYIALLMVGRVAPYTIIT